jgi:hypothetical protein
MATSSRSANARIDSSAMYCILCIDFPPSIINLNQCKGWAGCYIQATSETKWYSVLICLEGFIHVFL